MAIVCSLIKNHRSLQTHDIRQWLVYLNNTMGCYRPMTYGNCLFIKNNTMGRYRPMTYGNGWFTYKTPWVATDPWHTALVCLLNKHHGCFTYKTSWVTTDPSHMVIAGLSIKHHGSLQTHDMVMVGLFIKHHGSLQNPDIRQLLINKTSQVFTDP